LEEDDYDLIEENLGVKVERRVCFIFVHVGNYCNIINMPFLETIQKIKTFRR